MRPRNTTVKLLALTAVLTSGALGATALAVGTGDTGRGEVRIDVRRETAPTTTMLTSYQPLPGARVLVQVPPGQSRLVTARFTAESSCSSPAANEWRFCAVRIVAEGPVTGLTELEPRAASIADFAFDTDEPRSNHDGWESHAIERSIRLNAGSYQVYVQRAVTSSATAFSLDDWHFAVEQNLIP
jgi:hypothetical protein